MTLYRWSVIIIKSLNDFAGVAELADALDSGSSGSNLVEVQVLSPAFFMLKNRLSDYSESLFCVYGHIIDTFRMQLSYIMLQGII